MSDTQIFNNAVALMCEAEQVTEDYAAQAIIEDAQLVLRANGLHSELHRTADWFKLAVPSPTDANRAKQLGCHLEETAELLEAVYGDTEARDSLVNAAEYYKKTCKGLDQDPWTTVLREKDDYDLEPDRATLTGRKPLADAIGDGIVTLVGLAHMYGLPIHQIMQRINDSNFSKFVDGKPVFDANGKIAKGPDYKEPDLSDLV